MNKYRIYPSLMDAYSYMLSLDDGEAREAKRRELIDSINRVPHEPVEAASRGTALNGIVDSLIEGHKPDFVAYHEGGCYYAELDGFTFRFDDRVVYNVFDEVYDCLCQVYNEAEIIIPQGIVTLYGYADYVNIDNIIDLKTTMHYNVGKYRRNWQHKVYPYCFVKAGDVSTIQTFHYLVAELYIAGDAISARLYDEQYDCCDIKQIEEDLRNFLAYQLIPFLEDNRMLITNAIIFA